ncbi:Sel1 domain protein repeat-containing protein [Methylocella silvestris BL2]|uniref:Sel1 domain protein repeat-containing protein n=1 Tax=Methylocella silvestris (strain DSM 15510 / CIP 108128 / LMG 27833 / NCIMB 13906 / BL2) TaxID=395965 RepID=B8EK92_METSB|nr:tetratricopeptide repeat protein [Methylocella silvestris]ACK50632.1 Sel1 domain protein repeat-containing protein [Methylocella silvestris BL2]
MSTWVKRIGAVALFGLAASLPVAPIRALEGAESAAVQDKAIVSPAFKTPRAALQAGLEDFRSGASDSAVAALKYAAAGGETLAQWKLATIYAAGQGVPHDDLKAYEYFSQIIEGFDEDNPNWRDRSIVSNAFVSIATYSLNGIAQSKVKPDPARALALFKYAAANFGDATAQYSLARMYLDGAGGDKDSRQGVRWLYLAADKGHVQAQALLGQMLFTGDEGLRPQRARALMWLTLAREAALDSAKDQWIIDAYEKSLAAATETERQTALTYLEDHLKRRN